MMRRMLLPRAIGAARPMAASSVLMMGTTTSSVATMPLLTHRVHGYCVPPPPKGEAKSQNALRGFHGLQQHRPEDEKKDDYYEETQGSHDAWFHLPFMPPFHTVNIIMILILANITTYLIMRFGTDDIRDFMVEHFTLSHENAWRIYPLLTHAFYQEHLMQLAIDVWLFLQFGRTMLGFLGGVRMAAFWAMCAIGGATLHLGRQYTELYYGMDPLEVRGRAFGPNPFILGLVGVEGLIFRNMNFYQNPPIPFLVLTAFVMVIDVWRIFTTKPEEHGATTGGALVAYIFWALPTRRMGLDKLTAAI
eukprot:PhM_4_TR17048/c0_g1_i1/m.34862